MKTIFPHITVMGERAILIEFAAEIDEKLLERLLFYKNLLQQNYIKENVEITNTYTSLLIFYGLDIENIYDEVLRVKQVIKSVNIPKNSNSKIFHVPLCYEPEFGVDLEYISNEKNMTIEDIITCHHNPIYIVYFIGFLPGFLYLGGLDGSLQIPRKNTPRKRVEKGAVGIGENQTGIYPKSSPGGWQIIGNSPIDIFDQNGSPPCQISPGDKIKFYPVHMAEYEKIKRDVSQGKFQLKSEPYDSRN